MPLVTEVKMSSVFCLLYKIIRIAFLSNCFCIFYPFLQNTVNGESKLFGDMLTSNPPNLFFKKEHGFSSSHMFL